MLSANSTPIYIFYQIVTVSVIFSKRKIISMNQSSKLFIICILHPLAILSLLFKFLYLFWEVFYLFILFIYCIIFSLFLGPFDQKFFLEISIQLCDALHSVHKQWFIHKVHCFFKPTVLLLPYLINTTGCEPCQCLGRPAHRRSYSH